MNPQSTPTPEQQPSVSMAEIPQSPEASVPASAPIASTPAAATSTPSAPVNMNSSQPVQVTPPAPIASANPALAEDVDVIEKEWVDQAESIIQKTAGDPHAEEEQIEDLQIDYMKKRYGKDVAKSD